MNKASKCVVPRQHVGGPVAVATAGILALSLVTVPPNAVAPGPHVRAVQLTALAWTPQVSAGAILESPTNDQAAIGVRDGTDITPAGSTSSLAVPPAVQPASAIAQEPPQLDISWIGQVIGTVASWFPGPTGGIVLVAGFSLAFITVVPFLAFIYDPIVKTVNLVLNLFGLPLLPVYIQDPVPESETAAAPLASNAVPTDPVALPAKTGAPAGEQPTAKTAVTPSKDLAAKAGRTVSKDSAATAGETVSNDSVPKVETPSANLVTKTDEPVSTETVASADQTLSTTSAKLGPSQSRSRVDVSQRPQGLRHSGDANVATRPTAGRKLATTGGASSPASTSPRNSSANSSSVDSGS